MHKRKNRNLFCCLLVSTSMLLNGCATYYTRFSENPLLMGGAFVFDVVTLPVQIVFLSTMAL